jgi:hypothetical protein
VAKFARWAAKPGRWVAELKNGWLAWKFACLLRQLSECEFRHFFKNQYVLVPLLFHIIQPWAGHCQGVSYHTSVVDPDPDSIRIQCGCNGVPRSGSGFGIQVWIKSARCSLLRAEGFSCSLDISKLQFLIKKDKKKCSAVSAVNKKKERKKVFFFFSFGHQNFGSLSV